VRLGFREHRLMKVYQAPLERLRAALHA